MSKVKNKIDKITVKLVSSFIGITVSLMAIIFLISFLVSKYLNLKSTVITFIVCFVLFASLLITFYSIMVHNILLKKINNINNALTEATKGNYNVNIDTRGNDELAKLAESFNMMTKELQANAFLSKDFARYVSHEFKTPLSVIRSYAELSQNIDNKKEINYNLDIIIEETDKLAALSNDILTLCKLDSTNIIKKNDKFSPSIQVKNILQTLQTQINEKHLKLNLNLEDFEIVSDENLMYLVWQNLIVNAIKFSDLNGNVEISLKKSNNAFDFKIKNYGIGIKTEDADKIFQPFFMGDKSHNGNGHGLGLTLTKQIVIKLGGEIVFSSSEKNGTEFIVSIPI